MRKATQEITKHYTQTDLSKKILTALEDSGKDINALTREDIAAFDEFHIRGREATLEIAALAGLTPGTEILDLGCGIGGAARTLMTEFKTIVTGVDLVEEFVLTARELNDRIGLDGQIKFHESDAQQTPFAENSFDVVFSQHISMNIEDKSRLVEEVRRVLRPGGRFVLYEICAGNGDQPHFPVPWAGDPSINFLIEPQSLRELVESAGFKTLEWRDVTAVSLKWIQELMANMRNRPSDAPPPLGLNLLMGASTGTKLKNMMQNMQEDRIAVIQGVMELPA
jgi:SAM-dependent methyltransferase